MEISTSGVSARAVQESITRQDVGQTPGAVGASSGQDLPPSGKIPSIVDSEAAPKVPEFDLSDLDSAMEDLRSFIQKLGRDLDFTRDDKIDRNIVTVRDAQTNALVRQIPSEEIVAMSRQIADSLNALKSGLLLNDQV